MNIEKPILNGKTAEENIQKLETWAGRITDEINYAINHLDKNNFVETEQPVTKTELENILNNKYEELRGMIVSRTKGA